MSDPTSSSLPPAAPVPPIPPVPPLPPAKKGMSTGCIIGLIVGIVGLVVLVIVGIIAVLAALAVPVGQKVLEKARILQTKAEMKGLELAIKGYQTEYNRLPNVGQTDETAFLESQGLVLDILMNKNLEQNPRQIPFYEPPLPQGKGGAITMPDGTLELRDVFGNPYRMHFDWNSDSIVPDPEHSGASIAEPVIIYSAGPDGDYNTWQDNVKSWEP